MTAEDVKTIVIPELVELYQKPFGVDSQERALKAYIESLSDVPGVALQKGWKDVRRDHTSQSRPPIGVILEACRKYYETKEPKYPPSMKDCFNTEQGQHALREGHAKSFYATCYQRKEVIDMFETKRVIDRCNAARAEMLADDDYRLREAAKRIADESANAEQSFRDRYLKAEEGVA